MHNLRVSNFTSIPVQQPVSSEKRKDIAVEMHNHEQTRTSAQLTHCFTTVLLLLYYRDVQSAWGETEEDK
jgi:hypothetical protein